MKEPIPYELDGGEREHDQTSQDQGEARAITICVPERRRHEHGERGPETWELTGDDATRDVARVRAGGAHRATRSAAPVADGFSHARSLAYATTLVFVAGDHRPGRPGERARAAAASARLIVDTLQAAVARDRADRC